MKKYEETGATGKTRIVGGANYVRKKCTARNRWKLAPTQWFVLVNVRGFNFPFPFHPFALQGFKLYSHKKTPPRHCVMVTFCSTICSTPYSFAVAVHWIMANIFFPIFFVLFSHLKEYKCSVIQNNARLAVPFTGKVKTYITHKWMDLSSANITSFLLWKYTVSPLL